MRHWWLEDSNIYKSIPRALFLGWLYSDPKQLSDCMDLAIRESKNMVRKKRQESQELRESMLHSEANYRRSGLADEEASMVAKVYQWLKAESDAALLALQVEALKTLGPLLATLPSVPKQ